MQKNIARQRTKPHLRSCAAMTASLLAGLPSSANSNLNFNASSNARSNANANANAERYYAHLLWISLLATRWSLSKTFDLYHYFISA
jgi:hypothetical protein